MENNSKFSNIEIILRILLFLIFALSAILKLIVGFDNFEMNLMESNIVDTWVQSSYVCNTIIITEICCAVFALFGKFNWFQNAIFTSTFIFYLISLALSFNTIFYQDYTFVFFGFDIYSNKDVYFFGGYFLNVFLFVLSILLFLILQKKGKSEFLRWPFQTTLIVILSIVYIAFGSFNPYQYKLKTEKYSAGVTNWSDFNTAVANQYPEFKNGEWTVAFFSTSCDHCKKFARKISFTPNGNEKILYVFWDEEEAIEKFKKNNNVKGPHLKLPQYTIMNIVGQEYPAFFKFENGTPTANYTGHEFSYAVIDAIIGK